MRKAIEDINSNSFVIQNQLKDSDPLDIENTSAEKPLLSSQDCSDKQVNMTITSMDSALSNSDNCSDIEMENIPKSTNTPSTPISPLAATDPSSTSTTLDSSSPGNSPARDAKD